MLGAVNSKYEAVVALCVRGPGGAAIDIDAIVDTGFTGMLVLPDAVATALGLQRMLGGRALLADGTIRPFSYFEAAVDWNGTARTIAVTVVGDEPLVGMGLLAGHRVILDVIPTGAVSISPLA